MSLVEDEKFGVKPADVFKPSDLTVEIWDKIQTIQTDFCFPQEIASFYESIERLQGAETVLDVGCGNGYFLSRLRKVLGDKKYSGIDVLSELVEKANSKYKSKNMEFRTENYFYISGNYDLVITRLFWQHLASEEAERAFKILGDIVNVGGSVMVVDAYDEVRLFYPNMPEFEKVIYAYTSSRKDHGGRNRNIVVNLKKMGMDSDKWEVGLDNRIVLPSSIPGYLNLYRKVYFMWLELFEETKAIDVDLLPAKRELEEWCKLDYAFTQAGIRILRLDKVA